MPINHYAHQVPCPLAVMLSCLSAIMPIGYHAHWLSYPSAIMPIGYYAHHLSCSKAIMPISYHAHFYHAHQPSYQSTIIPISNHISWALTFNISVHQGGGILTFLNLRFVSFKNIKNSKNIFEIKFYYWIELNVSTG